MVICFFFLFIIPIKDVIAKSLAPWKRREQTSVSHGSNRLEAAPQSAKAFWVTPNTVYRIRQKAEGEQKAEQNFETTQNNFPKNTKDDSTLFISVVSFVQFSKPENENNSNDIPRPAAMLSCKSLGRIYDPIRVAHYRRHSREQPYAGLTSRNGHRNYFHLMIALISCPLFGPTSCTRWHQPSIDRNSAISHSSHWLCSRSL